MNEDETFRILKRKPFEDVLREWTEVQTSIDANNILHASGWTWEEFWEKLNSQPYD